MAESQESPEDLREFAREQAGSHVKTRWGFNPLPPTVPLFQQDDGTVNAPAYACYLAAYRLAYSKLTRFRERLASLMPFSAYEGLVRQKHQSQAA